MGGGGAELAASCDMRFGLLEHTVLNQMEVPLGILPGGTGTQRLPRLVGRGRAMEIDPRRHRRRRRHPRTLGSGSTAPSPPRAELDAHVDDLARRIATFPPVGRPAGQRGRRRRRHRPVPGLLKEGDLFEQLRCRDDAQTTMRRFLDQGGQTEEGELRMGQLNLEINRPR